jgi:dethiobiotin synthetase
LHGFFVTGTDTDVGKTVVAAWLLLHMNGCYWKPVQSGLEGETDTETVQKLTGAENGRILPETYRLPEPLSPHESARRAGIEIDMERFDAPECGGRALIVEGAGGLLVPLNDKARVIDLIEDLHLPVILVARSTLGTINHTLLSLEALRRRGLTVAGVVMSGPDMPHNRAAIECYGKTVVLAEIPPLDPVSREALLAIEPELDLDKLARSNA